MSEKPTSKKPSASNPPIKSDLARLDAMSDNEIDYSDIPATPQGSWAGAHLLRAGEPIATRSSALPDPNAPLSAIEARVWKVLEKSKQNTKSIVKQEREAELIAGHILSYRLRNG